MSIGMSVGVLGTGRYVPEKVLSNYDLEQMVDTSDEWIVTRTGIRERRISSPEQASSDLAYHASLEALKNAGLTPEDIDLIIVATITPDMAFPSTACVLQERLGAKRAAAFDLSAACSGFIYGLATATSMITAGMYKHVLVVGAECLSKITDYTDRNTCILFGDGAGAVVLGQVPEGRGFRSFVLGADGGVVAPPYGEGSLGIEVMAGEALASKEKAAYGNEVDFAGENFLELTDVGFHVFTTGENFSRGEPMPVINIEIDPNLDHPSADDYTTATWVPDDVAEEYRNTWSPYIDATANGEWFLSGGEGIATGCADGCSWDELIEKLDDGDEAPTILTVAVGKGRDTGFVGAVDGLRLGDTIYDFEPFGVVERPAQG